MSMADYEPASGWNLPPGCFEGDPRAPWNQPDPWEGHECAECRFFCVLPDEPRRTVCLFLAMEEGEAAVCEVGDGDAACESFEE